MGNNRYFNFDNIAGQYARYRKTHPGVLMNLLININRESKVLEIGCGTGNYIITLSSILGCQAWGIDISKEMLFRAQERSNRVCFKLSDVFDMDFPDDFFDLAFSVNVIHHISDLWGYFKQCYRVLKSKGKIMTATDSEWTLRNRRPLTQYFPETLEIDLKRYHPIEKIEEIMSDLGFLNIKDEITEYYYYLEDISPYREKSFSSLNLISKEAFERGIKRMEEDLKNGPIPCVSRFVMIWGEKR